MSDSRIQPLLKGAGLGLILAAYPFVFIPITIYLGNIDEFSVPLITIIKSYLPLIVLTVGLTALSVMLVPVAARNKLLVLIATLSVLFWIQGNILVWNYGLLDGRVIDWSAKTWQGWLDSSVWVALLIVALFIVNRISAVVIWIAVAIFVTQAMMAGYNWLVHADEIKSKSAAVADDKSRDQIYRFSSKQNVLHILADGFQSDIFEELIAEGGQGKRLAQAMQGFSFYRDHMGAFPFTHMSMPAILSGKIYKNHIPIEQHMDDAVGGQTIFSAVEDDGYEVDIVTPGGALRTMYEKSRHTNLYTLSRAQHFSGSGERIFESARLLDLSLFRLTPHFAKRFVYNDQLWLVQAFMIDSDYMGHAYFRHIAFLQDLSKKMSADRSEPVYKYLHLTLSHNPMVTDENCRYAGGVLHTVRKTVKLQAGCALKEMVALLERMKDLGIYDDALIIFMADHGAWIPPTGLQGVLASDRKSIEVINPKLLGLALPLLAIKRPGDTRALKISNAPSWITDTPITITQTLNLDAEFGGRNVFGLTESERRERRFYYYEYRRGEWDHDYLTQIGEAIVDGPVKFRGSWRPGKKFLPQAKGIGVSSADLPLTVYNIHKTRNKPNHGPSNYRLPATQ
jgi:hypothetical protein